MNNSTSTSTSTSTFPRCPHLIRGWRGYTHRCERPAGHTGRHQVGAISTGESVGTVDQHDPSNRRSQP